MNTLPFRVIEGGKNKSEAVTANRTTKSFAPPSALERSAWANLLPQMPLQYRQLAIVQVQILIDAYNEHEKGYGK